MTWHIAIYDLLVQLTVASLVVLAVAGAAVLFVGEPARRLRVIQWTLAGLLVLPLLALVPGYPRWSILPTLAVVVDAQVTPVAPSGIEITPPTHEPIADSPVEAAPNDTSSAVPPMPDYQPPPYEESLTYADVPETTYQPSTTTPAQPPVRPSRLPSDFRLWVVAAYLVGVSVMALWSLVGLVAAKRLLAASQMADDRCREMLRQLAGPKSDRVAIVVSSRAQQPCAVAWRPTTIILPEGLCTPDNEQRLRWALAHEWSHVEHGDTWTWSLASVVRCFYFYQPLLWLLRRHLRLCQDYVADAQATRMGGAAEDYAEFLTSSWITKTNPPLAAGLGIGGRTSDLTRRVVMLVERPGIAKRPLETATPRRWNLAVLSIAVVIIAALACLGTQPPTVAAQSEDPPVAEEKPEAPEAAAATVPAAKPEPKPRPRGDQPAKSPVPDFAIDLEMNRVPLIFNLTQKLAELHEALEIEQSRVANPARSPKVVRMQQQILDLQEKLEEMKANLRPKLIEMKKAEVHDLKQTIGQLAAKLQFLEKSLTEELERAPESQHVKDLQKQLQEAQENEPQRIKDLRKDIEEITLELRRAMTAREQAVVEQKDQATAQALMWLRVQQQRADAGKAQQEKSEPHPWWSRGDASQPFKLKPGDILNIEVEEANDPGFLRKTVVEASGKIALGARFGRVSVLGKTQEEAEVIIVKALEQHIGDPRVQVTYGGRSVDGTANPESAALQSLRQEVEELKQTIRDMRAGKLPGQIVPIERK